MKRTTRAAIPEPILRLQQQLDEFRASHRVRTKLPDSLWQAATELARQHGVYAVAHPLRLDHSGLSRRVHPGPPAPISKPQPKANTFVELVRASAPVPPGPGCGDACVVEFESARGGRMRVRWPGRVAPDWLSLLRAWRDAGE
jgi:hypothetical protein